MKLNYKRTILIGFGFMSILAFWQIYDQVIPYLLEKDFGLSTFWTNAVMAVDNILAIFMLPLFGTLSDKTNTRLGKRTPYILFGTVAASVFISLLAISQNLHKFPAFMVSLLTVLVVMSTYRSPAVAYMPDVTEKPLRSTANAIINLVGNSGGIFATVLMMILLKTEIDSEGNKVYKAGTSFMPLFFILIGFMLLSVVIMTLTVKENSIPHVDEGPKDEENKGKKVEKSVRLSLVMILLSVFFWFMAYNAVATAFSRYCQEIWGKDLSASSSYLLVGTVVAILSFIPLGILSSKLGRKKMILAGIVLMTVCYCAAFFLRTANPVMYLLFGLVGIGWASINVNSFPMVVEMCKGGDIGKYTGIYYAFSMGAQIATPIISGFLIQNIKQAGYLLLFPYAAFFSALAFMTMMFVKHGDNKPPKKGALIEHFDVDGD